MTKQTKFGIGLMIGAAVGATAAFFLSPKSGKENREDAKKKIGKIKEHVDTQSKQAKIKMDELIKFVEEKQYDEKVKKMFSDASEESKKMYATLRKETATQLSNLRQSIEKVDTAKYQKTVDDIIAKMKKDTKASQTNLDEAKRYLMSFIDGVQKKIENSEGTEIKKA